MAVETCSSLVAHPGCEEFQTYFVCHCPNLVEGQTTAGIEFCVAALALGGKTCIQTGEDWPVSDTGLCEECNAIARLHTEEERLHAKVVAWARMRYESRVRNDPWLLECAASGERSFHGGRS